MKHNLKYPLENLNGQKITEAYPALAAYKEFAEADNKLLAYVIYGYDSGSGLMKHKDPLKRKEEALLLAGFRKDKTGAWEEPIAFDIMEGRSREVAPLIYCWLRYIVHSMEFAFWVQASEMVWQNIRKIGEPIEEEESKVFNAKLDDEGVSFEEAKKMSAKNNEKEKDVQAAYKTRNDIFDRLPDQIKKVKEYEEIIFKDDKETLAVVTEYINTHNAGRVEQRLMGRP